MTPRYFSLSIQYWSALLLGFCALTSTVCLADVHFQSGEKPVHVIELYTSEGCYSCPPADQWLSELQDNKGLFTEFIPVSFHVDYWNYLGWRDTYSRAEFSERQRRYYRLGQVTGVYTPGMFINGFEWTLWRRREAEKFAHIDKKLPDQIGRLTLQHTDTQTSVTFLPSASTDKSTAPAFAYVAILGAGIDAPIPRGENKGKTLRHDFAVLELKRTELKQQSDGSYTSQLPVVATSHSAPRYALAAWVTGSKDNKPLQATGGWLPDNDH